MNKKQTTLERIQTLAKMGVDTSTLVAYKLQNNNYVIGKVNDDKTEELQKGDPIFASIIKNGVVPERSLFRRWVLSQTFHMLAVGRDKYLDDKNCDYQFKMLDDELRTQVKLEKNDGENFAMRNRWFNKTTVANILTEHLSNVLVYALSLKRKKTRAMSEATFVLAGKTITESEMMTKVVDPIKKAIAAVRSSTDAKTLYDAFLIFFRGRSVFTHRHSIALSATWKDAYLASGAYFSMRNLILFHGCAFRGVTLSNSLGKLDSDANKKDTYVMIADLDDLLRVNNIDIKEKMTEWYLKKTYC